MSTTKTSVIIPDIFTEAVQAAFREKNAFMGSQLAQAGVVVISGTMTAGRPDVGDLIKVPYFDSVGEFDDVATDGDALTPKSPGQTLEQAQVAHAGIAIEMTRWARGGSVGEDIYDVAAKQVVEAATRKMDTAVIAAAVASGTGQLSLDKFSATVPRTLDWDLIVDGKMLWGDGQEGIAGIIMHSRVLGDMMKLKDSTGRPMLVFPEDGSLPRVAGIPVAVSDRLALDSSTLSAVTSAGTTPPVITLTGTPNRFVNLRIECTVLGARGTSKIKWSIDGGVNFSAETLTAATIALTDPSDSNAATGVTLNIAAGNAATDNVWTATSILKHTTLLCKKASLAFWYNQAALRLQTDSNILKDTDLAAMHLYYAALRYKRVRGSTRTGIVRLRHN